MLAVETGVPRLFPLNGILTAATPCETIRKPVSNFGGSLQTEPFPMKPVNILKSEIEKFVEGKFLFSNRHPI